MKMLMSGLIAAAVYLTWGPLPVLRLPMSVRNITATAALRASSWRRAQVPSPMPFLWTFLSEVLAGSLIDAALLRACEVMPPMSLANTCAALAQGDDIATALVTDAQHAQLEVLADVAMVYRISTRTGAPITESLVRIIDTVRNEQIRRRTLAQETASTKATVFILATLPLLGVVMGVSLGLNPLAWFLQSALGALCLMCGLTLEFLGWLWVRQLVRRAGEAA